MKKKQLILILMIAILAVVTVTVFYTFRKNPDSVSRSKPEFIISASELVDEFMEDEDAANQKYLDKIIQIGGEISGVEELQGGKTVIYLKGNSLGSVSCLFSGSELGTEIPEVGKPVTIKGKCTGFVLDVVLTMCTLVE
jgi:hypothetical protein